MGHFIFINSNATGLKTINEFLNLGHEISYIESTSFITYDENNSNMEIKNRINNSYKLDDTDDLSKIINLALNINLKKKVDGVICVAESSMEPASSVAEALNLPFPSYQSVLNCRNKEKTRSILKNKNIENARYHLSQTYDDVLKASKIIGFPLVIKPKSSRNSYATAIVKEPSELKAVWDEIISEVNQSPLKMREQYLRGFLIEEYLQGEMVSVEIIHDGKNANVFMISERKRSKQKEITEYRIDMPANIEESDLLSCVDYTKSIVEALELSHGIFHIEIMLTDRGPVLVEVNPRLMGGYMPYLYNTLTKDNLFHYLGEVHLGKEAYIPEFKIGNMVASAIRFDVAADCQFLGCDFNKIVKSHFSLAYYELPQDNKIHRVSSGDTIGRIQVIFDNHQLLEDTLLSFFKEVNDSLGLELFS